MPQSTYRRSWPKLVWYRLTQTGLWLIAKLCFRYRCRGTGAIPSTGPVVLVCNHTSHLDPPLIGCGVRRPLAFLARESLFAGPLGWLIRSYDAIPIDRDGTGLAGIRAMLKRIRQGDAVLLFPEGTRSRDGRLQDLKPGFLALVRRGGACIVPLHLTGTFEALPRGRRLPKPHPIRLEVGPPLQPEMIARLDDEALLAEVARRISGCRSPGC